MKTDFQEDYEGIKRQLNDFISELSCEKSYVLIDAKYEKDKKLPLYMEPSEEKALKTIIESDSFKNAIKDAKDKLGIDGYEDDHDFAYVNEADALEDLTQVVAVAQGKALPYGKYPSPTILGNEPDKSDEPANDEHEGLAELDLSDDECEKLIKDKGEDMWWVYAYLGEEGVKDLKASIKLVIDEALEKSGMPKTWFPYMVACLLGMDPLDYHIKVMGEHAKRLEVVNVERDFVDLRIFKGAKRVEYQDVWKAIEDYLSYNISPSLMRVEDEGDKLYNDKIHGVENSKLHADYKKTHISQNYNDIMSNTRKLIRQREAYKKIK